MVHRPPSSFGALLKQLRLAAGLSQEGLASRAAMSMRGISDLERGARLAPHRTTVEVLARALDLSEEDQARLAAAVRRGRNRAPLSAAGDGATTAARPSAPIRSGFPRPLNRFIGREGERVAVQDLLRENRLVTLTGPPGVGKTRLAIEVAAGVAGEFPDGVAFVSLASLSHPSLVLPTIAQTLGVREAGAAPLIKRVQAFLARRRCLVVLDNFEHVAPALPLVTELLDGCPSLTVLVTSRTALRAYGAQEFAVEPLPLPEVGAGRQWSELAEYDSVRLFVERARAIRPRFALTNANADAIADICRRLDGLPLAIELAAARIRLLTPTALLGRLNRRLPLLTGGASDVPSRQQTMREAIAWSYDLLSEVEQTLFRRLGVFVGEFDLAAAEAVCAMEGIELPASADEGSRLQPAQSPIDLLDGLESLVAKSLVRAWEGPGQPVFHLLETIREYALELLEQSGEAEQIREAHAAYFLRFAEEAPLDGEKTNWLTWLGRALPAINNLRSALDYFVARRDAEKILRLARAMAKYWHDYGSVTEGYDRVAAALEIASAETFGLVRIHALDAAAQLALDRADYAAVVAYSRELSRLRREMGDMVEATKYLHWCGLALNQTGDYAGARAVYEENLALARQLGDPGYLAWALGNLADTSVDQADVASAEPYLAEEILLTRRAGDRFRLSQGLWNEGRVALLLGDFERAATRFDECLAIARGLEDATFTMLASYGLAYVACHRGDLDTARRLVAQTLRADRDRDFRFSFHFGLDHAAVVAMAAGRPERAARLAGACTSLRLRDHAVRHPVWKTLFGRAGVPVERPADDSALAKAWDEGEAMSQEQAIEYALSEAPHGNQAE